MSEAPTALVTGASGFAGRHLANELRGAGVEVTGASRRPAQEPATDRARVLDLLDAGEVDRLLLEVRPQLVFHLAAEASVVRSWRDPAAIIRANVATTLNLLESVRRHAPEARVLVACSGEEYGIPDRLPVDEEHRLRPRNPYAVSKASVDMAAGFYADAYGLRIVRTRAFNHAGPGQTDTYVVSALARQIAEAEARSREDARVEISMGNPHVKRDFTDVRDVVRAYRIALERCDADVFNVCSGEATLISDILDALAARSVLSVERQIDPALVREDEVPEIRGSHEKLTRATGWRPQIPFEQTLADTLDWWRAKLREGVAT
jgi:GDP-4-dehydro-6-deoxy-D-mannose reductase